MTITAIGTVPRALVVVVLVATSGALSPARASTGKITIPIRWCGMQGTNAVDNPGCVCETNLKNTLWRRHERPTDAIYTPNCNVGWRSGAIAAQPTFPVINDPCDPTINPACPGVKGDILVDAQQTEYRQAVIACMQAWNVTGVGTIGVVGVNIRRFVDVNGMPIGVLGLGGVPEFSNTASQMSTAGGFAVIDNDFTFAPPGPITGPCLPPATPPCNAQILTDPTDQVTGHEFGHALSLPHLNSTVMNPTLPHTNILTRGGPGMTDTVCPVPRPPPPVPTSQCGQVRLQALCHVNGIEVDPPPVVDTVPLPLGDAAPAYVDLSLVGLVDDVSAGEATFYWEVGLFPALAQDVEYGFALDLDGNAATGGEPASVGVDLSLAKAELVGRVVVDVQTVAGTKVFTTSATLWKFLGGAFVQQQTLGSSAIELDASLSQVEPPQVPVELPLVTVVALDFDRTLLAPIPPTPVPDTIPFQARSLDPATSGEDVTPTDTLFLNTPTLPVCQVTPQPVMPGDTVTVTASGLTANQTTHVLLGPDTVATGTTDALGDTSSMFAIPPGTRPGQRLVTIGVDDPDDAITADCSVLVVVPPNHFQCYRARTTAGTPPFGVIQGVQLVDQFGAASVKVEEPRRLCAPVDKEGEDPTAPSDPGHLVDYLVQSLDRISRLRGVQVTNQFGTIVVDTVRRSGLLVPTAKSLTAPPPPLSAFAVDHFACYKVKRSLGQPKFQPILNVDVVDQLGAMQVDVKRPRRLCLPVNKNEEDPTAPSHPDHLMCYRVTPSAGSPPFTGVSPIFVNNQFGPHTLGASALAELCVPSEKNLGTTTTTSTTSSTTTSSTTSTIVPPAACCYVPAGTLGPLPVCLDAATPDVFGKCTLLDGTLVFGVCDPDQEVCVPSGPVPPNDFCCECSVSSPPFPHPQLCFEGVTGHEAKCQPPCVLSPGLICAPGSERCVASPSGAFLDPADFPLATSGCHDLGPPDGACNQGFRILVTSRGADRAPLLVVRQRHEARKGG
jgi:hypothetical protein